MIDSDSNSNLVEQQEYIENFSEELEDTYLTNEPPETVKKLNLFHILESLNDISQYINLEILSLPQL